MRINFRPLKFTRFVVIAAAVFFFIIVFYYLSHIHSANSFEREPDALLPQGLILPPFRKSVDFKKENLELPDIKPPTFREEKFVEPAFLEELDETADENARQIEKEELQNPRILDGKGISLPKFTVEEIRGSLNMDLKDPELARKRQKIKEMTKHAWDNYVKYAWGHNELRPKSKTYHDTEVLGRVPLGATIVDSIDTLYIMGLDAEYEKAAQWIKEKLDFSNAPTEVSVFEITIRFIGGLLSIYSMTGEKFYLDRAHSIIENLLPAFNPTSGLPTSLYNLQKKKGRNFNWASGGCHILAEVGTLHMEFQYISELLGDQKYSKIVHRIRDYLVKASKTANNEFHTYIRRDSPTFCINHVTLSGEGDSFFEYLLKEWIRTGHADTQAGELYNQSLAVFQRLQMFQISSQGSYYLTDSRYGSPGNTMSHLTCFAGGMFALGAVKKDKSDVWFTRGRNLTETCRKSYVKSDTGLGPESFVFTKSVDAAALSPNSKVYLLRPETVESYFYMWRFTHDPIYRKYAWDVVQALEKYCRLDGGYAGLRNVYDPNAPADDVQQSFFIAETLKYLYLIFCDDSVLPLDRWVFNTEAHPFPILPRFTA